MDLFRESPGKVLSFTGQNRPAIGGKGTSSGESWLPYSFLNRLFTLATAQK